MVDVCGASAQQSDRIYRIGWLWQGTPGYVQEPMEKWTGPVSAFSDAMQARSYVLGKNLTVDARSTKGDVARLAAEAESLVASGVDLIVAAGTAPTAAAVNATKRIPIVFAGVGSPVEKGLVASLSDPGGNVTGIA